jgi:hypothetical protein
MRGMLVVLVVSVIALLLVAGAVVRHIRRQRQLPTGETPDLESNSGKNTVEGTRGRDV